MTINRDPYYDSVKDRHYVDKDPDNKWTYVWDLTTECTLNNTTVVSATYAVDRMTVLAGPTPQSGVYMKVKVTGPAPKTDPNQDDAFVTLHCVCANGEEFDKTLYFKSVSD